MAGSVQQMAARLSKMQRLAGASGSTKSRMAAAGVKAEDWWGICRTCGDTIKGSLETLQAHTEKHRGRKST